MRSAAAVHARRALARAASALLPAARSDGLRILTYHRVNDSHPTDRLTVPSAAFRAQMQAIAARGRGVVRLHGAVEAMRRPGNSPAGLVAVTFDDGYRDNFTEALPILEESRIAATFFVATGLIGSGHTIARYRDCCSGDGMLDWAQVREMRGRGHDIGGHGRHHRELGLLSPADADAEVEGCALDIEAHTGERPRLFCYPRGSETPGARQIVARHGFQAACTVYPGCNLRGGPLLALRRTEISGDDDLRDFELKLQGGYDAWHLLLQALRRGRLRRPR